MIARLGVSGLTEMKAALASIPKEFQMASDKATKAWRPMETLGSSLLSAGSAFLPLTAAIGGFGAASTSAFKGFEQGINRVSALGEITGKSLEELKAQAVDLGAKTQFSAKQAADGMGELAAAGFKANDIMAAMPGVLDLAASGQISVGEAAETTAAIMGGFGISAQGIGHAVDVMAKAAASGALGISDLGLSMKYVGPVSLAAGLSFEETAAAVTLLSNSGIKAEQAGTSLRQSISRLIDPPKAAAEALERLGISVTDGTGKMRPFADIIADLGAKGATTKDIFAIFGDTAASSMQALVNKGAPALRAMTAELQNSDGAAKQMAGTLNSGLTGAWEQAMGAIETAGIAMGQLLAPAIIGIAGLVQDAAGKVAEFAQWFGTLPEPIQMTVIAVTAMAAAIGPMLLLAGSFASAIASLGAAFQLLGPIIPGVGAALSGFALKSIPAAITALTTFTTTTIPAAISGIGLLSTALIAQAETSIVRFATVTIPAAITALTTFATTAIPAAIGAITTFATTTVPAAIASLTTFTTTTIPAATASFVTFARTGIAGAIASLGTMTTAAIPALLGALATLGVAASVAAAAFVGWKLGEWFYENIEWARKLGDAIADIILIVPGVESSILSLSGASAAVSGSQKDLEFATRKLEESLKKKGVTVDKTGLSLEQYNKKLNEAAKALGTKPVDAHRVAVEKMKKELLDAKRNAGVLAQAQKELGLETKKSASSFDDYSTHIEKAARKDEILWAISEKLSAAHRKLASDIADAKIRFSEIGSTIPTLIPPSDALSDAIQRIVSSVQQVAPAWISAIDTTNQQLAAATEPIRRVEEAYQTLGIKSEQVLKQKAESARKAYEDIKASGTASARTLDEAWVAYEEARIAAARQAGETIPAETDQALKKIKERLSGAEAKTAWSDWSKQVSTIITDLGRSISSALWDGESSWGQKGMKILKSLGESVTRAFVEPATKAIGDLISGAISDLIGGKGFGGILDRVKELGGAVSGVFGGGGSAIGGAAGSVGGAASGAGGSVGGIGGSVGSAGGAAAGAGTAAIVGAVGGVASAISGFIGNFQMAGMNKTLDEMGRTMIKVEHHTMYTLEKANDYWPKLESINGYLWDTFNPAFASLMSTAEGGFASAIQHLDNIARDVKFGSHSERMAESLLGDVVNAIRENRPVINNTFNIQAATSPEATADAIALRLRMQGGFA
jgi:TP901 family phage tail tape measure protein